MGTKIFDKTGCLAAVLVVLVIMLEPNSMNAQRYTCWGGCYNQCILGNNSTRTDGRSCYYQCLNGCLPRSPSDYQYYCQIRCSLQLCNRASSGGAEYEKCLGQCDDRCKI